MPDGRRILYHAEGPHGAEDIWSGDVETGERELVLGSPSAERHGTPTPVRNRIVFISRGDGENDEVYVANGDGGPWTQLTDNKVDDYAPSWSPDDSRIVFQSPRGWSVLTATCAPCE